LKANDVPEPTPALFERLLPYAFALGVTETWVNAFAPLLTASNYRPTWLYGGSPFNLADFTKTLMNMKIFLSAPPRRQRMEGLVGGGRRIGK
jgi:hypothetical protein